MSDAASVNPARNSNGKSKRGGARIGAGRKPKIRNAGGITGFPGSDPYQPTRTYIYMPLVDPKRELTAYDRLELLKKARWLYNAIGFAKRCIDGPAENAVGCGLAPKWCSKDRTFNAAANEAFCMGPAHDARAFDAAGRVNFYDAQALILKQVGLDGDFFAQPLQAADGSIRARFIEGIFVGNSGRIAPGFDEKYWFDGVRTTALGLPVAYRVLYDPIGSDQYTDIPADQMWHICRRDRHGYVRGSSALTTACNSLHDIADITAFTKHSHKIAAQFPFYVTTERKITLGSGLESTTDTTTGQTERTMKMRSESGVPTLLPGEQITPNPTTVPGITFEPFMAYLARDIAWARGLSPEVLWNITTTGGANNRYVGVEAQRFYEKEQDMIIYPFLKPYVTAWTWAEIEAGRLPFVEDWAMIDFSRPAKLTVDNGRDGKLLMDQMAAGFLPPDEVHAMFGRDGMQMDREVIGQAIRRRQMLAEMLAEAKMPADEMDVDEVFPNDKVAPEPAIPAGQPMVEE